MKKLFIILMLLLVMAAFAGAEGLNLGNFPLGKWLDARWNAVWEFRSGNIRILDSNTSDVVYDFDGKTIQDFSVKPSVKGVVLSFYCVETGKKYKFTKPATNMDLIMEINTDTGNYYKVKLPFQK